MRLYKSAFSTNLFRELVSGSSVSYLVSVFYKKGPVLCNFVLSLEKLMYFKNSIITHTGQKHAPREFLSFFKKIIYREKRGAVLKSRKRAKIT